MNDYRREQDWLILAHLAELVLRGEARVLDGFKSNIGWTVMPIGDHDRASIGGLDLDQSAAYAEMLALRWAARAQMLGLNGQRVVPLICSSVDVCPTCGVKGNEWCMPTHAGERDPGGWEHPARQRAYDDAGVIDGTAPTVHFISDVTVTDDTSSGPQAPPFGVAPPFAVGVQPGTRVRIVARPAPDVGWIGRDVVVYSDGEARLLLGAHDAWDGSIAASADGTISERLALALGRVINVENPVRNYPQSSLPVCGVVEIVIIALAGQPGEI